MLDVKLQDVLDAIGDYYDDYVDDLYLDLDAYDGGDVL